MGTRQRSRPLAVVLVAVGVLTVGCGGGGDGSESSEAPPDRRASTTSTDSSKNEPSSAQALAEVALSLDPAPPGNVALFSGVIPGRNDGLYPEGPPMVPAVGPAPTAEEIRADLEVFLDEQLDGDGKRVAEGLAVFDAPEVAALIADPLLRAAFAGMTGTFFEPTIRSLLDDGRFAIVRFGVVPEAAIATSAGSGDTGRFIFVSRAFQYEDFRYLVPVMGHEILHDDATNPGSEEAVLNALSGMSYLQVLLDHPELAHRATEGSRQVTDLALWFLNSREKGSPISEIVAPNGVGVAPGSERDAPDLWTFFKGEEGPSPGAAALPAVFELLGLPRPDQFSLAVAETFEDLGDGWMSDQERVQLSVLLQLVTPEAIATAADLSVDEVIETLDLKPYLDAIP